MKRMSWIFAVLLCATSAPALAVTDINIFLGQKDLSSSDWGASSYLGAGASLEQQDEFGVLMNFGDNYGPVSFAVDLLGSSHDGGFNDPVVGPGYTTATTSELDLGARGVFEIYGTSLHPYVGGGLAFVSASIEDHCYYTSCYAYDSNGGIGFWLDGGIFLTLAEHFNIGLDARYSQADVTLYGQSVNAGGTHAGITLGYTW